MKEEEVKGVKEWGRYSDDELEEFVRSFLRNSKKHSMTCNCLPKLIPTATIMI